MRSPSPCSAVAIPFGILAAALLFGALRAGLGLMQVLAGIPAELVDVIQAIILLFLAADIVVRHLFRIRATAGSWRPDADLRRSPTSYGGRAPDGPARDVPLFDSRSSGSSSS